MTSTYMRYLEGEIGRFQKRLQKIKENPDPTKLRANAMLYELQLDDAISQLEDYKAGKPFSYGYPRFILHAMGFTVYGGHGQADRTAQGEGNTRYIDILRDDGWPDLACDRTVVAILLVTSGDYPKPHFVSVCNESCEFASHNSQALAQLCKVPYFVVDIGNDCDEENLKYVADQLGQEVEFIEKNVPGTKYNEDKLIELQYYDRLGAKIQREVYEFRKRRPCPINPRDAQREQRGAGRYRNPEKGIEYLKAQRDEIFERAEKGIGVMKEEKLRLMWTTVGINHDESIYKWLEDQGVALHYAWGMHARQIGIRMGFYGDPWNGRKLTPIEEEARFCFYNSWNGRGQRLIDDWLFIAKDQGVDGIVYPLQPGCLPVLSIHKLFADAAEAVGIPTLRLDIRGIFREGYNQQDVKNKLSNFMEICLARKQQKAKAAAQ